MAEKKVSVRIAVVGGNQARAELEGIGDAGTRSFANFGTEMDAANVRMRVFWRTTGMALAALGIAAAAGAAAMVRTGLATIDAQANMAQSLGTTTRSLQVMSFAGDLAGVSMDQIAAATRMLTLNLSNAAGGTGTAVAALNRLNLTAADLQALPLDERIMAIQDALAKFIPPAEQAAVASDLFGDKAALAFSRIDSATLRQASKDITDFGVAVSDQDADQIRIAGDAIDRLSLVWTGLVNRLTVAVAPALQAVADALADAARMGGVFQTSISFLGANIARIGAYAVTFAAFFAGRWVVVMAAAAFSVRGLATALVFLRGALIRTGIGALIVGAGELVYWFTKLVQGAGGFGNAMGLLKDVVVDVWNRIGLVVDWYGAKTRGAWSAMKAVVADAMQNALVSVVGFGNSTAGVFKGAFEAVKAIWKALPDAIGDFVYQAVNSMISGVESMLNAVISRINTFIGGLNKALALLPLWATGGGPITIGVVPEVNLEGVTNPFEGAADAAGTSVADAFAAAMAETYLETPDLGLDATADAARVAAADYAEAAGILAQAANRPLASWQALKDAFANSGAEGTAALADAAAGATDLEDALNGAGAAAGGAGAAAGGAGAAITEAAEEAKTGWAAVTASLEDYAKTAMDWGAGVGGALVSAFNSAENAIGEFVKTGKLDFASLATSIIADLAKIAARKFILGPIASMLSGALGGGIFASVLHAGGAVGSAGSRRMVPAMAFANAPRMHTGGYAGLRADEVPAILQRGERVLSRSESRSFGSNDQRPMVVNFNVKDAASIRQSRAQMAADAARIIGGGGRNR